MVRIAGIATALILVAAPMPAGAGPAGTAESFVRHLQRADVERAKRLLDDPRYRSEPRGGVDAYFVYESGYEPNLAFLVGQPFAFGAATETTQRSDWYVVDGTLYGTVSIPLTFEQPRPWVLPAPVAFGHPMPFIDFVKFAVEPARYPTNLTLRVRHGIEPGHIRQPVPRVAVPPPPVGSPGARSMAARLEPTDTYGSMMGQRPVDPAPVRLPSGEALTTDQLQRFLPRLVAITIDVSLVRRGRLFASWAVTRWTFRNAVVATEKGDVPVLVGPGDVVR
jgi:hypothetical protein